MLGSAARADEEDVISRLTARKQPSAGEGGPAVCVCECVSWGGKGIVGGLLAQLLVEGQGWGDLIRACCLLADQQAQLHGLQYKTRQYTPVLHDGNCRLRDTAWQPAA